MKLIRTIAALSLLLVPVCGAFSVDENSRILNQHAVWIEKGLTWNREEGATETHEAYAATSLLYFGSDGKFGVFYAVAIKQDKRIGLSEGEGEKVYAGQWSAADGKVAVNYRLVSWYKILLPQGQTPPAVPGAIQKAEIRMEKSDKQMWQLVFDGRKYEPATGFKAADLRSHLEIHEKNPLGSK